MQNGIDLAEISRRDAAAGFACIPLKKHERTANDAVARQFSATWEEGSDLPSAYITAFGKRVAVDVATLKQRGAGQGKLAKPRLRFDSVAVRLIESLRAAFGEAAPDGMTVLLTVPAPIRLASMGIDFIGALNRRFP
jgi:hypothetical protein